MLAVMLADAFSLPSVISLGLFFLFWCAKPMFDDGFARKAAELMGRLSFSVYLLHFPLNVVVITFLSRYLQLIDGLSIALVVLVYLLVLGAAAWSFERTIDRPVIALSRKIMGHASW